MVGKDLPSPNLSLGGRGTEGRGTEEEVPFWRRGNITAEGLARLKLELERLRVGHPGDQFPERVAPGCESSEMKLVRWGSGLYALGYFYFDVEMWVFPSINVSLKTDQVEAWWSLP